MAIRLDAFFTMNGMYLIFVTPLAAVIFLVFRFLLKVKTWFIFDLLAILMPGFFYWILYVNRVHRYLMGTGKTLANLIELPIIGISCGLIFFIRSLLAQKLPQHSRRFSMAFFFSILLFTFFIYIFTPALTE